MPLTSRSPSAQSTGSPVGMGDYPIATGFAAVVLVALLVLVLLRHLFGSVHLEVH